MNNVTNDIAAMMKMLGNVSGTAGNSSPDLTAMKGKAGAFDMELMMANKLFSGGSENQLSPNSMDMGVMNDVLMLEALTALNSVKGLQGGAGMQNIQALNSYRAKAAAADNISVKKMDIPVVSGDLSAKFESGSKGVSAIGYDRVGGTSYGKYQIASKTGTMDKFIQFLKDKAPEIANKLLGAGPADTGAKTGSMPDLWKQLADADPKGFEKLQHDFIQGSHYDPAAKMILEKTGVDMNTLPAPVREVLWSTSVQHGPTGASRLIAKAIDKLASNAESKGFPSDLVKEIYGERKGQFSSSTERVQKSVANRFQQEQNTVLSMLEGISRTA
ncbi:hypothetical protein [Desulfovibrio sp. JC022]|uniref:VgrG-related protein n=1 Tax=Desulfovibrio sp. JC022 TaxID=2593642 RepID=UPI0013D7B9F8|nr:hypothetical protein [Desulfovibrio sp. JC022]NDV22014.1 hypothetical protein [Desulfovibrio sp. JC022]